MLPDGEDIAHKAFLESTRCTAKQINVAVLKPKFHVQICVDAVKEIKRNVKINGEIMKMKLRQRMTKRTQMMTRRTNDYADC